MTRATVTPPLGRVRQLPENAPTPSNVVPLFVQTETPGSSVPSMTPRQMVEATRDTEAGWSPIDEDTAYRNAIFDLIGDYLPWAVCFIVMGLIGLWLACGHS